MSEADLLNATKGRRPNAQVDQIVGDIAAALTRADARIERLLAQKRLCRKCAKEVAGAIRRELQGTALAEAIRRRTEEEA